MSATLAAPAADRVKTLRAKLAALRVDGDEAAVAIERQEEALGRAVADGAAEQSQKLIRVEIANLEAQVRGIRSAVQLVQGELADAEREASAEALQQLQANREAARREHIAALQDLADTLPRLAAEIRPVWDRALRSRRALEAATAGAARAEGLDPVQVHDVAREPLAWADTPEPFRGQEGAMLYQLVRQLVNLAPDGAPRC